MSTGLNGSNTHWLLFEAQAFCETLEETNHHLQRELLEKQREFDTLKKTLENRDNHFHQLLKKVK